MFDLAYIRCIAGNGGNGRVSFRREKFISKGGPDGGNGGDGGSIILKATETYNTLQHFAGVNEYLAEAGGHGGQQNQEGHGGEDIIIEVPVGTRVWLTAENAPSRERRSFRSHEGHAEQSLKHKQFELTVKGGRVPVLPNEELEPLSDQDVEDQVQDEEPLVTDTDEEHDMSTEADQAHVSRSDSLKNIRFKDIEKILLTELTEVGQTYLLCKGGDGGRGNDTFKSSMNTTPVQAEYGIQGERKQVLFELRLIADVGLVGYPNAGKSTLLSIVTRANPKIANYPFTTLEPNLGVLYSEEAGGRDIVIADIPGLIEGASLGKGLGYEFLRHIQACRALVFILSLDEVSIFQEGASPADTAELLWKQYQVLLGELKDYDSNLVVKPTFIAVSKIDLYSEEIVAAINAVFTSHDKSVVLFSSVTRVGVDELQRKIASQLVK